MHILFLLCLTKQGIGVGNNHMDGDHAMSTSQLKKKQQTHKNGASQGSQPQQTKIAFCLL